MKIVKVDFVFLWKVDPQSICLRSKTEYRLFGVRHKETWLQIAHLLHLIDRCGQSRLYRKVELENQISLSKDDARWFFTFAEVFEHVLHGYLLKDFHIFHNHSFMKSILVVSEF